VLRYWLGQWDDALAELGSDDIDVAGLTYSGLRERGPVLLLSGVAALIAGRRDQRAAAAAEAAAEVWPARAAAASLRCRGLLAADPVPLREAVAHYRTAGPAVDLPAAHSRQARREGPGGDRPRGATPGHLRLTACLLTDPSADLIPSGRCAPPRSAAESGRRT
jgi:hypothetical protein